MILCFPTMFPTFSNNVSNLFDFLCLQSIDVAHLSVHLCVCLYPKTLTLTIAFKRYVLSYFTYLFLGVKTLSLVPKSRSSVKVKYQDHSFWKKWLLRGALVFHKHSLFSFIFMLLFATAFKLDLRIFLFEHDLTLYLTTKILDWSKFKAQI